MPCDWLDQVADIPRHVEARSALLNERAEVFGGCDRGLVVLDRTARGVSVIGDVSPAAVAEAVGKLEGAGMVAGDPALEVELPGWERGLATLYELGGPPRIKSFGTRLVRFDEIVGFGLPEYLLSDLARVHVFAPIAATFLDSVPVSFCHAVETETLWDVSIDTLEAFRGRGYAGACVAWMIGHEAALGRRPVWGAMDSNVPSQRVAEKLGFVPVDRIAVWEPVVNRTTDRRGSLR